MLDDNEILSLYPWDAGSCFRCARTGVDTTCLTQFTPESNGDYDVRACHACVLDLEAMSRQAAERKGVPYELGRLGEQAHRPLTRD